MALFYFTVLTAGSTQCFADCSDTFIFSDYQKDFSALELITHLRRQIQKDKWKGCMCAFLCIGVMLRVTITSTLLYSFITIELILFNRVSKCF